MTVKRFIPIALAALVAACSSPAASPSAVATQAPATQAPATQAPATPAAATPAPSVAPGSAGTLTVWLMNGSLNDNTVVQLDTDFQMAHPGWKVNYQVQQWNGIVERLTTALASNNPPDIIELGNTQAITFEAAGALADLSSQRQALGGGTSNSGDGQLFVDSLNAACVYQNKLLAMPFYAGDRVLIYNKAMLTAAGIDPASITSKDKLIAAAQALNTKNASVKDYSGLYVAGQNWYSLLQMIWDRGGTLATQGGDGKWTSNLDSPESMQGIQDYVDYYKLTKSTGPKDNDEMNPPEYTLFQQGKVGMFVGNGWEISSAIGPKGVVTSRDQVGVMAIPSVTDGKTQPVFLGGSVLAVAAKSKNQAQAIDWLKQLTSPQGQQMLIDNLWIPSLKSSAASIPDTADATLKVQAKEAAGGSGFTPNDPRWAGVEANNPLKSMLTKILSGQASIADAAKEADTKIEAVLNGAQ